MDSNNHLVDTSRDAPGTVLLVDAEGRRSHGAHASKHSDIVLVPQPSKDPEDPLKWSRKRKLWSLAMVFVYTLGVGIPGTMHYSVLADISKDTGITTADLGEAHVLERLKQHLLTLTVNGNGVMFLFGKYHYGARAHFVLTMLTFAQYVFTGTMLPSYQKAELTVTQLGWGCLLLQPLALAYGRRGVYLLSILLVVPIMVWTAYSSTPGEWYAHRIIIGIAGAPIESLPEISIADLMFAHERGTWMSAYVLVLFESNFIAPLIAGWFNDAYGWRWTMHFGAMIAAVSFVILFFGAEETMYFRHVIEGVEPASRDSDGTDGVKSKTPDEIDTKGIDATDIDVKLSHSTGELHSSRSSPRPYAEKLKPFVLLIGRPSPRQMFGMMIRPLIIIVRFPCIAWAGFIYGINLSWYQVLNGTASPVLSAPPYNWPAAFVGCIYVGPMVGAVFGCIWSGAIADKLAIYLARRNRGIREPEQRLWPLAVAGVFSGAGLITWVSKIDVNTV